MRTEGKERYKTLDKVGEGAFGTVYRALDRESGAEVALKRVRIPDVRQLPSSALRELHALRRLSGVSPHVVPLLDTYTHGASLMLVMPFVPCSLAAVLHGRDTALPEAVAARVAQMLLRGVCAIHAEGLLHRDLKPANLLIDPSGTLLIADLGQARPMATDGGSLSHAVATRWYRAPELLFGARRYGAAVDVWASGVVIAQLLTLTPLLPGESDIDQLGVVMTLLGSPSTQTWPGVEALPDYGKLELPRDVPPTPLAQRMPLASPAAVAHVASMVVYDPAKRAPPTAALADAWIATARRRPAPPDELLPPAPTPPAPPAPSEPPSVAERRSRRTGVRPVAFPQERMEQHASSAAARRAQHTVRELRARVGRGTPGDE
jgi:cell cycle related kinase